MNRLVWKIGLAKRHEAEAGTHPHHFSVKLCTPSTFSSIFKIYRLVFSPRNTVFLEHGSNFWIMFNLLTSFHSLWCIDWCWNTLYSIHIKNENITGRNLYHKKIKSRKGPLKIWVMFLNFSQPPPPLLNFRATLFSIFFGLSS